MLALRIQIGNDRYAIPALRIEAVLPFVAVRPLAGAPRAVAGIIEARGVVVPVIDLAEILAGRPSEVLRSTRIVLFRIDHAGGSDLAGLIVERATDTVAIPDASMAPTGLETATAAGLGPVVRGEVLTQLVAPEALLPPEIRAALFRQVAAAP